uniref:Uncharacterized protein n=1 Tax=Rhizophora mucronata TaxID=61149 RepID=A0A2P2IZ05_RHIMU
MLRLLLPLALILIHLIRLCFHTVFIWILVSSLTMLENMYYHLSYKINLLSTSQHILENLHSSCSWMMLLHSLLSLN